MKKIDFDNDSIKKNILQAALPMLAAQILSLLYNIVDRIYIARIPDMGTTALGAVGLCFPIIMLTIAFSNLFGSGGAPLFSIKRGMSDDRAANTIMNTSFTMVCTFAVVFTALCMIFAKPILIVFGASENALKYALPYLLIYLIGTLPSMISTGMNPFINAQGYSTTGMLSVAIGAVANLVLDPLFIFGFNFGIKGAAIATVISQILSAVYVLHFLRKKAELKVRLMTLSEFSENTRYAKDIISLGTSGCVMQLTNSLVSICCNNVLSVTGGDLYISVMTIVSSIRQMVETPIYAIVEGSSPVLSYNYGAKNAGRVKKIFRLLLITCLSYSMLLWAAVQLVPKAFVRIFTSDAALVNFTAPVLRIYLGGLFLFGIQIACQMTFTSLGKAVNSIVVAVVRKFVLLLPLIYLLPHFVSDPVTGVYTAEPIADILAVTFTSILFFFQFRKALAEIQLS